MGRFKPIESAPKPERAILVGLELGKSDWPLAESMAELERLTQTDGAIVVGTLTQRLAHPIPKTFIGSGKTEELKRLVSALDADVVIFDDELTPSQQANLEKILGEPTKVIDRTALILDIFGRHATTREGRLQVQLAQLQYVLPRLRGMWSHLVGEQTRGGIGSRFGQGESQLEVDRRLIRNRISTLKRELVQLSSRRELQSKARWESGVWRVALVGYTNAGKSTLLNRLTDADVYAQDELFATLDPTTRTLVLDEGRKTTVTDTVGFIQKLPTTLVEAFKSTLAEALAANLIIKVVDASSPNAARELAEVNAILTEIGAKDIRSIVAYNKSDLLTADKLLDLHTDEDHVIISATEGTGIDALLYKIAREAADDDLTITATLPYSEGRLLHLVHEQSQVMHESFEHEGVTVTTKAPKKIAALLAPYETSARQD